MFKILCVVQICRVYKHVTALIDKDRASLIRYIDNIRSNITMNMYV
jgi:hypothetical protein